MRLITGGFYKHLPVLCVKKITIGGTVQTYLPVLIFFFDVGTSNSVTFDMALSP